MCNIKFNKKKQTESMKSSSRKDFLYETYPNFSSNTTNNLNLSVPSVKKIKDSIHEMNQLSKVRRYGR